MLPIAVWEERRPSKYTHDEQQTLMTLWCLMPSPLMLGGDFSQYPADSLALITNDEVLSVNQDSLAKKREVDQQEDENRNLGQGTR